MEIISYVFMYMCLCGRERVGRSLRNEKEGMKLVPWKQRGDLLGKDRRTTKHLKYPFKGATGN